MKKEPDSLIDYILWMRDYSFSNVKLQDADAVVLCMLSYFDMNPLFENPGVKVRVRDCLRLLKRKEAHVRIAGRDLGYAAFLRAAASSRRFGELRMRDYADLLQKDPPVQFSALIFEDGREMSFMAFQGTDTSIAGWREDFMICFSKTRAQELAREYAACHVKGGHRWYLGGHSKGGNNALYAACMLPEEQLSSVEGLYLLDSPGTTNEVLERERLRRVLPRVIRIIPEYSVIGKLFAEELPPPKIVKSSVTGILQHSLVTWGIDHGRMAEVEREAAQSLWISEVLQHWIDNIPQKERPEFVRELFDALASGGAETVDEVLPASLEALRSLGTGLHDTSRTTKEILRDLPRQALLSGLRRISGANYISAS